MSPIAWALQPFRKYAVFSGRASRAEFWWFMLLVCVIYIVAAFAFGAAASLGAMSRTGPMGLASLGLGGILLLILWLGLIIPSIAVSVRRLHDTNRSGWWVGGFYLVYALFYGLMIANGAEMQSATPSPSYAILSGVLGLVMLIWAIALLVFYCLRGTDGPNRFGDDPYGNYDEVFR